MERENENRTEVQQDTVGEMILRMRKSRLRERSQCLKKHFYLMEKRLLRNRGLTVMMSKIHR